MYAFRAIMGKLWAVIFFEARYLLVLAKWGLHQLVFFEREHIAVGFAQ